MASDQGRGRRLRYDYQRREQLDKLGREWWDVVDYLHPPKVITSFRREVEAIAACRALNLREENGH